MTHLQQGWQFRVDFEGFEPVCQWGKVHQPIPEPTNSPSGNHVPEQERPDPRPGQRGGSTECWVTLPIGASVDVENCQVCEEEAPDGSKTGPYMIKWSTKGFGRRWPELCAFWQLWNSYEKGGKVAKGPG